MRTTRPYLLIGIDGGGTGCRVAICERGGERLSETQGGPANFTTDPKASVENIRKALITAAADAGLDLTDWKDRCVAHAGLAGVMGQADAEAVASALGFQNISVTDDRATSVAGALRGEDGILAAIGTGTIVAVSSGGSMRYFGGWGHELADQASGGWLGHDALRLTLLAYDDFTAHSDLTRDVLKHFGDDPHNIVDFVQNAEPGHYATFAPMVVEAARNDDTNAKNLMEKGAAYLNTCINVSGSGPETAICLSGGVGPHYQPYLETAYQDRIRPPYGSALDGALFLADQKVSSMEEVS